MKNRTKLRLLLSAFLMIALCTLSLQASGNFEMTRDGIRYIVRDDSGSIVQSVKPEYDSTTGNYLVRDRNRNVIAHQQLPPEADMGQIKIVAPLEGNFHTSRTRDFMGNSLPVLRELPASDPRFIQLKDYIESNPGLKRTVSLHLQARDMKIARLRQEVTAGVRDAKLAEWLISDLKKPIYLEVGDSGGVYHDPRGFVLAKQGDNGQVVYRDNSHANRLVVPPNSEVFKGGMSDPSAASVMAHEIGHMIMDQLYERPNYPKTSYSGPHSKNLISDEGFAISEGWAEAIETLSTKEHHDNPTSWRIQSQKNIVDNKYVYKNFGVVDGPNDGILKTGIEQLSTEGVNATLFYRMLTDNRIQAPFSKVLEVFKTTRPQTYRQFLYDYMDMYPEDRSHVMRQFLETTKYTTVDSTAGARYKAVHDARQAYLSAENPQIRANLQSEYRAKLNDYNQWKEQTYQQAVVEGKIDAAVEGGTALTLSDSTSRDFRRVRLSENLLRGKQALSTGMDRAGASLRQSFSVQSVAMTAGTSIAINLASQLMAGEKPSMRDAVRSVASMQFVGNVMGSGLGAAAGHAIAPLIQTFVPIPIVGALAGSLLPTFAAIAGGRFGGGLGAGMGFKDALRSLDPVAIAGQGVGSTIGAMLGAMIPIPVLGPMIGGIVGGIVGERIFSGVARMLGYRRGDRANVPAEPPDLPGSPPMLSVSPRTPASKPGARSFFDPSSIRIDPKIDRIPYDQLSKDHQNLKDMYEQAYRNYVQAVSSGDQTLAKKRMDEFVRIRDRYRRALNAVLKE